MNTGSLIIEAAEVGIRLYLKDGSLAIKAPKGALTPELRERLKQNKADIIACLEKTSGTQHQVTKITEYDEEKYPTVPLSYTQSRFWLINQFEPRSSNYNVCFAVRFTGALEIKALEFALNEIILRHEILRTIYKTDDAAMPHQVVLHDKKTTINHIDISDLAVNKRQAKLDALMEMEAENAFALDRDLMLRASLVKESDNEYVMLITRHHIASDGWSSGILTEEITQFYTDYVNNVTSSKPPLEIQYADYAVWQREWLTGHVLDEQLSYWTNELEGSPVLHNLSLDMPRPSIQSSHGSQIWKVIDSEKLSALTKLAKSQGATLFMLLNAAFSILLSRHSGQTDIVLGTSVANRELAELAPMVGSFANTLVLRSRLEGNPDFKAFLQQTKAKLLGAYEHQQIPIEKLIDELQPERSFSHQPLFQIMLLMQNNSEVELKIPGVSLDLVSRDASVSNFDLTLDVTERNNELVLRWEYATALFKVQTIERLAEHFEILLDAIIKFPNEKIESLGLFSEKERFYLLNNLNETQQDFELDLTLPQLFEKQVTKTPDAIALISERAPLSYQQLNQRANQLAHYLKEQGVKPDTMVGVCVERSSDMVIALLAVLKAGGAYVPLDPNYPTSRLEYMMEDSGLALVLSQHSIIGKLPLDNKNTHFIDDIAVFESFPDQNLVVDQKSRLADNLAYVIYTSGSTGNPKGVMIENHNLTNFLMAMQQSPGLESEDSLLAVTSFSFDIHTLEFFLPLISGARLVLASQEDVSSPTALAHLVDEHGITVMQATPATWKMLINNGWQPSREMKLLCGGEALSDNLKDELLSIPGITLWNMYGPTETSVWSSVLELTSEKKVRIGGPIQNTEFYVLTEAREPAPFGVVGELFIGGEGVVRGYLNQPELTAEKFINNPFGSGRLYITGDLVRWVEDGTLEYITRTDAQVKIRGHRIELGEVETVIMSHDAIREAVVVARDEPIQLVAYILVDQTNSVTEDLRRFLNGRLPIYMIPSIIITLDTLPLTPNGKLDRKALPDPDLSMQEKTRYLAPKTQTEKQLCQLWSTLLNYADVGIKDNFFEVGGHSLSAARITSEIRQQWSVDIHVKDIFEQQTIADLARMIDDTGQNLQVKKIDLAESTLDQPLSFAQQRLWLIDQIEPDSSQYNMPFALTLTGKLHVNKLKDSINQLVERHTALRTVFNKNENGEAMQSINPFTNVDMPVIDLSGVKGEEQMPEVKDLAGKEALAPFDLTADLLLRCKLLKLSDDDNVLLITVHHIAFDAWSIGIFTEELAACYQAKVSGKQMVLPELSIQYIDYSCWQRHSFEQEELASHLIYWTAKLAGLPTLHSLPLNKMRPELPSYQSDVVEQFIPSEVLSGLKGLAMQHNATLFMVINSALSTLIHRYSGESDIVIGTTIANRPQIQLQSLVGFFINSLVLRTDFSDNPSVSTLIQQSRQTVLDAYQHQEMPFELLVDKLQPTRSLSHNPLFQVMLTLHNTDSAQLDLPGLQIGFFEHEQRLTPFDLSLDIYESEDGLRIRWELATDLFETATIEKMAYHFERLITAFINTPEQPVSELSMLSQTEKIQLLHDFNSPQVTYFENETLHGVFEQKVLLHPEKTAVVHHGRSVSYSEVNREANRLAHYLIEKGVETNTLVGIYAQRSPEFLVSMLAVLKAGGTYVPLDPVNPRQRIDYMIKDAELSLLISEVELSESFTPVNDMIVLYLEHREQILSSYSDNNPQRCVSMDDSAYMIYTSGSTGNPKGALVHHGGALNHIYAEFDVLGYMDDDKKLLPRNFLQSAATSSDVSVWQFLAPVLSGGKTVILVNMTDMQMLVDLLQNEQVHLIQTAPVVLQLLVNYLTKLPEADCNVGELSWLMTIAEATPVGLINRWFELFPEVPIMNGYGPSEASDDITEYIIRGKLDESLQSVPIGKPIPNLAMYVVNSQLQLQPVGVVGELCVSGIGVGPGYWKNEQKTSESFVTNPYGVEPNHGYKLYRTGDLGRWLPNGQLELMGRIDNQVKVRGFRIELGEIEAALSKLDGIGGVAVLMRKNNRNDNSLAAYLVSESGVELDRQLLREQLLIDLPEYMIPTSFTWLDKMPLNAADKIDRHALPEPNWNGELNNNYEAPTGEAELTLCDIWQDVLGLERVGVADNFFGIGGDSILSVHVVSRANQAGVYISLRQLFEHQTIRELAANAASSKQTLTPQKAVAGDQVLLPIQKEFLRTDKVDQKHYNLSLLLSVPSELSLVRLTELVAGLYQRHDAFRLLFSDDPSMATYQSYSAQMVEQSVSQELVSQDEVWNEGLQRICNKVQNSLSLDEGQLFKATLISDGSQHWRLQLVMHHMICDGISWRILLNDLETGYQQIKQQLPVKLMDKTSSFQQWGDFLSDYANSDFLLKERDYWQQQLDMPVAILPVDHSEITDNSWSTTQQVEICLNKDETQALLTACHHAYGTQINDLLLSALFIGMHNWTGDKALRIYLEGHGREGLTNKLDFGETLGWFTSLYPIVLSMGKANLVSAVIVDVKEQLRSVPNKGIGFGLLTELSQDGLSVREGEELANSIMFNYLGQFDQTLGEESEFNSAPEACGSEVSTRRGREHQLGFTGMVSDACLSFNLDYNGQMYDASTMEKLAQNITGALQQIIKHCESVTQTCFTASDFPLAKVTNEELQLWQEQYSGSGIENIYASTSMQQGLLFHSELDKSAYVSQVDVMLKGQLDVAAFTKAWRHILSRNAVLRTVFVGESAQQLVLNKVELPWSEYDLRDLNEDERIETFQQHKLADKKGGFEASVGPLMQISLFRFADDSYRLLWSYHHALLDGWSSPLVMSELVRCYHLFSQGLEVDFPHVPSYASYIGWLQKQDQQEATQYWQQYLSTVEASTPLVFDTLPVEVMEEATNEEVSLCFNPEQTKSLKAFTMQSQITMNTLLQGAWAYLLHTYTGEQQVVFGETVSGRPSDLTDVESIVGLFINTLPVCVNFALDQSPVDWLQNLLKESVLRSEFGFLPLSEISRLGPNKSLTNLFESLMVFENYPSDDEELSGDSAKSLNIESIVNDEQSNFKLTIVVVPGDELRLTFGYRSDQFNVKTIEQLASHFNNILFSLTRDTTELLSQLSLLTAEEESSLLEANKNKAVTYPQDKCIHQVFEEQVARMADNVALMYQDTQLTYRKLDNQANQLAHYLIAQGVKPDSLVALSLPRSPEMVIAILAILKAGGAYVPLDPEYPQTRLEYMLADCQPQVLLTLSSLQDQFTGLDVNCVALDCLDWQAYREESPGLKGLKPSDLAYVIYTSGSTGQPKGVMVEHLSVIRLVVESDFMSLSSDTRFLQAASISFDAATLELWAPLLNGGSSVLYPQSIIDPQTLNHLLRDANVNAMWLTAGLFEQWSESVPELPSLDYVIAGGDVLKPQAVLRVQQALPGVTVINGYGPTENTTFTCCHQVNNEEVLGASLPIGRAINGTQLYVLNSHQGLLPYGIAGELYVGGDGVARGYLNQPNLTAEKFINNPFGEGRLYCTGDKVRYSPQGEMVFLGRVDHQVKIRGFRIELAEIEAVIQKHSLVKQVVVVANKEQNRLLAYLTTTLGEVPRNELRTYLQTQLPEYMVPNAIVVVEKFKLTANGKVDRTALPDVNEEDFFRKEYVAPKSELEQSLCEIWCEVLNVSQVGVDDQFFDSGGTSLLSMKLQRKIVESLGIKVSVTDIFSYPTIRGLAQFLHGTAPDDIEEESKPIQTQANEDVAVIGMALRFPDANTPQEYWDNLCAGKESISFFTDEELKSSGVPEELLNEDNYVKSGVILEGVEDFDAEYFGFTPREVEIMDPQQRLLFECSDEALQFAGYGCRAKNNNIGLFAGVGENRYLFNNLLSQSDLMDTYGSMGVMLGNSKDFAATRISHKLNLDGPSINIGTACSTSLVAISQACSSLLAGSCDMALAGAASIHQLLPEGISVVDGGIASLDGHCRPFDAQASGTRPGSGAAVVVLKRLSDALADGDEIHAVIKGSAINNDGSDKVGYTAPSVEGQVKVIKRALSNAGVEPGSIGYIETHGTGTKLGDPMEIAALKRVFSSPFTDEFCALGAVKANIGHLDSASGVAGFIKSVFVVKHGILPPNIYFDELNPDIDLSISGFYLNSALKYWTGGSGPRRAGISSFGIGGTNAHIVLEQPPKRVEQPLASSQQSSSQQLIVLSAKSDKALRASREALIEYINRNPEQSLADIAYTLQEGRQAYSYRYSVSCDSLEGLTKQLASTIPSAKAAANRSVVFLFTGQGSQYAGMAHGLYQQGGVFKETFDYCAQTLQPLLGQDIRECLSLLAGSEGVAQRLSQTSLTQPLLFSLEYAIAQLWLSLGVKPIVMIGHSLGEYVAATLAGVFSLDDALSLIVVRGKLMQSVAPGAMLSVILPASELLERIAEAGCSLAAINDPQACVISGDEEAIALLEQELSSQEIMVKRLATSHAYHSATMDPILPAFYEEVKKLPRNTPQMAFMSNVTGELITDDQAIDPQYWVNHLRGTVNFSQGIENVAKEKPLFLEVGPGRVLADMVKRHDGVEALDVFNSIRHEKVQRDDVGYFYNTVAKLWQAGIEIDWSDLRDETPVQRVTLPPHPYMRQRYWVEAGTDDNQGGKANKPALARVEDWFYSPVWSTSKRALKAKDVQNTSIDFSEQGCCLLFVDKANLVDKVVAELKKTHPALAVFTVHLAADYGTKANDAFEINPANADHYQRVLQDVKDLGYQVELILHGWNLNSCPAIALTVPIPDLDLGINSILHLCQAIESFHYASDIEFKIIINNANAIDEYDVISAANATLLPVSQIITSEYSNLNCQTLDVHLVDGNMSDRTVSLLSREVLIPSNDKLVVLKDNRRWTKSYEQIALPEQPENSLLKPSGVYVISGGLGGIGLSIAEYLAKSFNAKLVLTGRSPLPERETWEHWLKVHGENDEVSQKMLKIKGMESKGAQVMYLNCDVSEEDDVRRLIEITKDKFTVINGFIHSAGVAGGGLMSLNTPEKMHKVIKPKIKGTLTLVNELSDQNLDFFVMCSSLASVIGEVAQFEYSAANAFQDAIAYSMIQSETQFIAINWDAWGESGMATKADLPEWMKAQQMKDLADAISDHEGQQLFTRIMQDPMSQVIISRTDVNERLIIANTHDHDHDVKPDREQAKLYSRPDVDTEYIAPETDIQKRLTQMLQVALGVEPIGIEDNFFELGGDSLLLVKVVTEINVIWEIKLSLKMIFDQPCVSAVACKVEQMIALMVTEDENNEDVIEEGLI